MMIEAEHLFKRYGTRLVVDDLSLHVDAGDVLGFIGPNGAGKTTTMKMISGVMPPYAGTVRIDGIDIEAEPRLAKSRIGFLPENAPLHMTMTVRAFLAYTGRLHGFGGRELARRVDRAIERCALKEVAGQEIESLSKGYKRRVCLAQSILHDPKALIMDEPTDGLDPNQKYTVREMIKSMAAEGKAIIISTHILEEVDAVCTKVVVIAEGEKKFDGTPDELKAKDPSGRLDVVFRNMTMKA
jgi:ABC-2 type transport system ATP-binding protein